ncbi:MAG: hypothetical protein AAF577_08490 [Pseudomonadota bacterium]
MTAGDGARPASLDRADGGAGEVRATGDLWLLAGLSVLVLCLGFFASTGPLSLDEALYLAGAVAMASEGAFTFANALPGMAAPVLTYSVPVGERLAPQYPSGYFILAAPFVIALGTQGLAVLNAIAAALSLWLTRSIALALFAEPAIARGAVLILALASFLTDYAVGLWPHATALAFVLGAARLAIAAALATGQGAALRYGALAGLIASLALTIRADTVLVLPPLLLWLLYAARLRLAGLAGAAAGISLGLALASLINGLKFGAYLPIYYGRTETGGGISLDTYRPLLPVLALGLSGLIAAALLARRPGGARLVVMLGGFGCLAVMPAALALPELARMLTRLVHGLHVLILDMSASTDGRLGIERAADGTLLFWGFHKQALGQSLPWLGVVLGLGIGWREANRGGDPWVSGSRLPGIVLALLISGAVIGFFARTAWHGGLSANMRYFLPAVPFLAMLAAAALTDLRRRALAAGAAAISADIWIAMALAITALIAAPTLMENAIGRLRQDWMSHLFLLIAIVTLVSRVIAVPGVVPGALLIRAARSLTLLGLIAAGLVGAAVDLTQTQARRAAIGAHSAAIERPETPYLLVVNKAELGIDTLWDDNGALVAARGDGRAAIQASLAALSQGHRVLVAGQAAAEIILAADQRLYALSSRPLIEAETLVEIGFANAAR